MRLVLALLPATLGREARNPETSSQICQKLRMCPGLVGPALPVETQAKGELPRVHRGRDDAPWQDGLPKLVIGWLPEPIGAESPSLLAWNQEPVHRPRDSPGPEVERKEDPPEPTTLNSSRTTKPDRLRAGTSAPAGLPDPMLLPGGCRPGLSGRVHSSTAERLQASPRRGRAPWLGTCHALT